jgi:hypothetical protein
MDKMDGAEMRVALWENEAMSDADLVRLARIGVLGPAKWGVQWPTMEPVVPAGKRLNEPVEQVRKNAYLVLRTLHRRRGLRT